MMMEMQDIQFWQIVLLGVFGGFMLGHNLWLVARQKKNGKIRVEVNTSDEFPQSDSAVRPERVANFRLTTENRSQLITAYQIEKDSLVAEITAESETAFYLAVELYPHPISLTVEKFAGYIADEDAQNFVVPHLPTGDAPQRESYTKFAKSFYQPLNARNNNIFNAPVGHQFEIVPQTSLEDIRENAKMRVLVLFEGQPLAGVRVSFGGENVNGGAYLKHARTAADETAEIETPAAGLCFLRTHFIRPHVETEKFEWESFWASLTFRVPPQ